MIIASGVIGAGKTSLTEKLAEHLGTNAFYEPVEDNPALRQYYEDPVKYGFSLQIYFMNKRFEMIKKAYANDNNVLDRSIYEDKLFTEINMLRGNISPTDYEIYCELLDNMMEELPFAAHKKAPDLLVHIDINLENELKRIKARGRDFEQSDDLIDYYRQLNDAYAKWYEDYDISPKIKIDGNKLDFVNNEDDLQTVFDMVDLALLKRDNQLSA